MSCWEVTHKATLPSLDPFMAKNMQIKTHTNTGLHKKTMYVLYTPLWAHSCNKKKMDFAQSVGSGLCWFKMRVNALVAPPLGAKNTHQKLDSHSVSTPLALLHPLTLCSFLLAPLLPLFLSSLHLTSHYKLCLNKRLILTLHPNSGNWEEFCRNPRV